MCDLTIYCHKLWLCEVPVILKLWTKTDTLDLDNIMQLMNEGNSLAKAKKQAPEKVWADFENENYPIFNRFKYPPEAYVVFQSEHYSYPYLAVIG